MTGARRIAEHLTIAAFFFILLVWGNTLFRQWSQYSLGEDSFSKGDVIAAIAAYEAAIHMYTPFGPFVEPSAERLWSIARGMEQKGDTAKALVAYRALRSSFYAVRGLASPGTEWIARCDTRISAILAAPGYGR